MEGKLRTRTLPRLDIQKSSKSRVSRLISSDTFVEVDVVSLTSCRARV